MLKQKSLLTVLKELLWIKTTQEIVHSAVLTTRPLIISRSSSSSFPFLFFCLSLLSHLLLCVLLSPSLGLLLVEQSRPCNTLDHPHTGRVGGSPSPVPWVLAGWLPTSPPRLYSRPVRPESWQLREAIVGEINHTWQLLCRAHTYNHILTYTEPHFAST